MENQLKLDPVKKLFKEAFWFYINRFWKLTGIALLPFLALILLLSPFIIFIFLGIKIFAVIIGIIAIPLLLLFLFSEFWSVLALIYAINKDSGILSAFQKTWHNIISFWWIVVLMYLIILGGFFMGIIPGIIFSIWFMFAVFLLIDQKLTGMNALLRSKEYVKGYWGSIVGRGLVLLLFLIAVNIFVYVVISLIVNDAVGDLASSVVNLILTPFSTVFTFFIYKNLVALKPELTGAPVAVKKGFFIFSAVCGILAVLLIPFLLILSLAPLSRSLMPSRLTDKNLNAYEKISVGDINNKFLIYDNPEFRFRFKYPAGFIFKFPNKLNTQSSTSTVAFYLRIGAVVVRVDTSEHEETLPLIKNNLFKEELYYTQENKIKGIKQEFPVQIGSAEKNVFYVFNLKTPPELLSEIHKGVSPLRDKLILKFFVQNSTPQLESILEKIVSTLEFY